MRFRPARIAALVATACWLALATPVGATGANQVLPPLPSQAADIARADLAVRLEVDPGSIDVVDVTRVDFPDTSLGCPRPDRVYAQVIRPGYHVLLAYADEVYDYRVSGTTQPLLCGNVYEGGVTFTNPSDGSVLIGNNADGRLIPVWIQPFTRVAFSDGVAARWSDLSFGTQLHVIGEWDEFGWVIPQSVVVIVE